MKYTIIIPVKEINKYIKESIPHIFNLDYKDYEVIILPNNKPKKIPKYLDGARVIPSGRVSPAAKRDIGAKNAKGEILAFLDDDSYPQKDWLTIADKTFKTKGVAAINGPAITPRNVNWKEKVSGAFFESSIGGGAAHRCKDMGKSFEINDTPSVNLMVRRDVFLEVGGFGSEYWPGEDSLFCQKLKDAGYKIWHQNNLIVYHHRRDSFYGHLKQVADYGRHRGNFFRKGIGCSRRLNYLIPSLFLLSNMFLILFNYELWGLFVCLYFIVIFNSFLSGTKQKFFFILSVTGLTFLSHLTYGVYFIIGFFTKDIKSRLR